MLPQHVSCHACTAYRKEINYIVMFINLKKKIKRQSFVYMVVVTLVINTLIEKKGIFTSWLSW